MPEPPPGQDHEPFVSLVIPSRTGGAALLSTIAAFARDAGGSFEIVVPECATDGSHVRIRDSFPQVRVLHFEHLRTIPELRAAGMLDAHGEIVAMTGDRCVPGEGWLQAVRRAHRGAAAAVGGAVENGAGSRLIDWAVFFCEYGRYMNPLSAGRTADLPGQNVSYKRDAIEAFRDLLSAAWEPLWHWRLQAAGAELVCDPSIVVVQHKHWTLGGFVVERYHYARSFAGQRLAGASWWRRLGFAVGAAGLPAVVLVRLARQLLPKRRHLGLLLRSIPYFVVFACVWAAGECVGYAVGPGASARHIN